MYVSDEYKFIFFHIPKTAGTAIHLAIKDSPEFHVPDRTDPEPKLHHMTPTEFFALHPEKKNYFTFAVVRNPWERLLSGYLEFVQKPHRVGYTCGGVPITAFPDFEAFVKGLYDGGPWMNDPHFRPQFDFIFGNHIIEYIIFYEELNSGVDIISSKIHITSADLDAVTKRYNEKPRQTGHGPYQDYYTEQAKEWAAAIYKKDIKAFSYEF